MKINFKYIALPLVALAFAACNQSGENKTGESNQEESKKTVNVHVPVFQPDSSYRFVAEQVAFGPRVPNTKAHDKCAEYLVAKLKSWGAEVTIQKFDATAYNGTVLKAQNIIASINPEISKRIVLAAHWDTRPFADQDSVNQKKPIDGANDGGSGVAILMEVLRAIQADSIKPKVGIDVVFFDVEDYGQPEDYHSDKDSKDTWCLGSQYWSKNPHKPNYTAFYGILLDMAGAKNARFAKDGTSMHFAPAVTNKVWAIGQSIGYGNYFVNEESSEIIDDHLFVNQNAKIPMIDIIEYDPSNGSYFGKYWHTHNDNMSVIDKNTLQAVGRTVLCAIYSE